MTSLVALVASAAIVLTGSQPQLVALGDWVYLTYGQNDRLHVAVSSDGGNIFGAAVALPKTGKLSLGMHRGPRIAVTNRAVLVAAVAGARGGGADGDVHLFRSTDRGATWSAPVVINDVPASAREGLHALAATPTGLVVLAWLDLREKGTRIYAAISRDHGATWTPDALAYASPSGAVCECCHPSIAMDPGGRVAIMFRNSVDGNRDMYVTQSDDRMRFAPATKVGTGSWLLDACPMDGGGLVHGENGLVAVWRRAGDVFLTTPRVPEERLGSGRDPVVAEFQQRRDLAWSTPTGVVLVQNGGAAVTLGPGRFPSLIALRDTTVVAWEHDGQVMLRSVSR